MSEIGSFEQYHAEALTRIRVVDVRPQDGVIQVEAMLNFKVGYDDQGILNNNVTMTHRGHGDAFNSIEKLAQEHILSAIAAEGGTAPKKVTIHSIRIAEGKMTELEYQLGFATPKGVIEMDVMMSRLLPEHTEPFLKPLRALLKQRYGAEVR